jgi:hypothetical protein
MGESRGHIVLLGDSIFDNGAYVSGGPDVVAQLRSRLPQGWEATLLAVDGAVTVGRPAPTWRHSGRSHASGGQCWR